MKNILKLSLLLVLIVTNYSCKKENNLNQAGNKNRMKPSEIGYYHNVVVSLYLNNKNYKPNQPIDKIGKSMINLMKEKYPNLMKKFSLPEHYNYLVGYYKSTNKGNSEFDLTQFTEDGFQNLVTRNIISIDFKEDIIDIVNNSSTYNDVINKIQIVKNKNLNNEERYIIEVFESIANNSHTLWSNYYNGNKIKPSTKVILADIVGGVLGSLYSGIFGIIQGGLVSAAVNEGGGAH